jgi:hypothetical protein
MDKAEILSRITEIGTCEDEVERRTMLATLSDDVAIVFDENATLTEANNTYKGENEKLREANMKLFLRVGEHKTPEEKPENEVPPEKRSFNNLFDEKGNIK